MKLFDKIFKRSRSEPVSESDLAKYLSGDAAWSGVDVDRTSVLGISAVWASVRIISETIASLPLILYRRLERGKERATDHPLYEVLQRRPNSEQTAFAYREVCQPHILLNGNSYSYIDMHMGRGEIAGLWPLDPMKMDVQRRGNSLVYEYDDRGKKEVLLGDRVFHMAGLGYDGIKGYSVLSMFRQLFGAAIASDRFASEFWKNSAQPKGIIKLPRRLADKAQIDRMKETWMESQGSWGNKHRVAILEDGAEWQSLTIPPDDAQFLETRKFQVTEIARMFRVPPHLIADLDRATFNNIEHQGIEFVVHTMRPWLVRWEQAISRQLLPEADQQEYFAEFKIDALLRGDSEARWNAYRTAREIGVMSANDIRELENLNPIEGGDSYFVPMNWVPTDQAGIMPEPQEEPMPDDEANSFRERRALRAANNRHTLAESMRPVFADAARRIISKESRELRKGIGKHLRSLDDFDLFMDKVYSELPEYIRQQMTPVFLSMSAAVRKEVGDELGIEAAMTPEAEDFVRAFVTVYTERHIGTSRRDLRAAVERAVENAIDMGDELERKLDYWSEHRPSRVALNETVRSSNAFAKNAYLLAGVTMLRWVALGAKSCPYCSSMDGSIVGIEQDFAMPGDILEANTGDMRVEQHCGHPPLHAGCVCQIVASA